MISLFERAGLNFGSRLILGSGPVSRDRAPIDLYPKIGDERWSDRALEIATWSFLALGVMIRLVRFFLTHPLWGDESFVVANLLERGYLGLLRPLDYQQVAPVLFLWIELTAAKLLGYSEWSLRLFPMCCGIASLFAFRHLASRLTRGLPLLLSVAILAVAINPIRHSGEVKPYASDFLVSTILMALVVEWWRRPERSRWLWALALLTPVAMGLSLPSTFVIGGISLAISTTVGKLRIRRVTLGYLAFNAAIVCGCLIAFKIYGQVQTSETKAYMDHYWSAQFPPWRDLVNLPLWLVRAFTGHLFSFPAGGANGASLLTVICFVAGIRDLIRRGRGVIVGVFLAPLGLALVASSFRFYPFGESERLMQFEGPMICLGAGLGLAWWLGQLRRAHSYRRMVLVCLAVFASIGVGNIVADLIQPAKSPEDLRAREFARWFWVEVGRDSVLACSRTDLGLDLDGGEPHHGRSADYLCLQKFYSPRHRLGSPLDWTSLSTSHPLKCVIYDGVPVDSPLFARWMELMSRHYRLNRTETYRVNAGLAPKGHPLEDHLAVLVFTPRAEPVDPVAIARMANATDFRPRRGSLRLSHSPTALLP